MTSLITLASLAPDTGDLFTASQSHMAIFHSAIVQRIIRLGFVIFSICFTLENLICSQNAVLSLKCVKMHFLVDYLGAREVCQDMMCGNSSELSILEHGGSGGF